MKLMEIKSKPGTYIGVRLTKESVKLIRKFIKDNQIPNGVQGDNIHITLVYSRKHLPNAKKMINTAFNEPPQVTPSNAFHLWGDDGDTLVVEVKCPYLIDRHEYFRTQGATHDYDDYTPHITLSYNAADFAKKLETLKWDLGPLFIETEYTTPLDLDWTSNNDEK